jgi:hypothetical protein
MSGAFRCGGDEFEPEWLQPKINLRIHQTAGMNCQDFHFVTAGCGLSKPILAQGNRQPNSFPFFACCWRCARIFRAPKGLLSSAWNKVFKTVAGSIRRDSYVSTRKEIPWLKH